MRLAHSLSSLWSSEQSILVFLYACVPCQLHIYSSTKAQNRNRIVTEATKDVNQWAICLMSHVQYVSRHIKSSHGFLTTSLTTTCVLWVEGIWPLLSWTLLGQGRARGIGLGG